MAGGTSAFHAGALKFGLREGFSRLKPTPIEVPQPSPSTERPLEEANRPLRPVLSVGWVAIDRDNCRVQGMERNNVLIILKYEFLFLVKTPPRV